MRVLTNKKQYPTTLSQRCCSTSILGLAVIKNGAELRQVLSLLQSLRGVPDLGWLIALSVALGAPDSCALTSPKG